MYKKLKGSCKRCNQQLSCVFKKIGAFSKFYDKFTGANFKEFSSFDFGLGYKPYDLGKLSVLHLKVETF